jgi:hypothetical protein
MLRQLFLPVVPFIEARWETAPFWFWEVLQKYEEVIMA